MTYMNRTTEQWQQLDQAHHLHPFSNARELADIGVRVITRAKGCMLGDSEGHEIMDGMAGLWNVNLGYGRKELAEAAYTQMLELPYYNTFFKTTNPPAVQLAEMLAEVSPPGFQHVFYGSSGSESNDTNVKLVRRYWDIMGKPYRKTIISRLDGYHGSTVMASALGGMQPMHAQDNMRQPGLAHIYPPHYLRYAMDGESPEDFGRRAAGWLEEAVHLIGPDNCAAFIGEPIQGAGGLIYPPPGYWAEIQRICDKYDMLLIADEVICGFGRTGNWFGSQTFGIKPHLMTMAKGITSGYVPMSGTLVHDRIAEALKEKGGENFHGYTYSGHPVSCAVAIATMELMRREGVVEYVRDEIGPYFQGQLRTLMDNPLVGEVRGIGMIAGIEMLDDRQSRKRFAKPGDVGMACREHSLKNGLMMRAVGDTMILSPVLTMTRAEVDELVRRARAALDATARDLGRL